MQSLIEPTIYSNIELEDILDDLVKAEDLMCNAIKLTRQFFNRDLTSTDPTYKISTERMRTDVSLAINNVFDHITIFFDFLDNPDTTGNV